MSVTPWWIVQLRELNRLILNKEPLNNMRHLAFRRSYLKLWTVLHHLELATDFDMETLAAGKVDVMYMRYGMKLYEG